MKKEAEKDFIGLNKYFDYDRNKSFCQGNRTYPC